MRSTNLGWEEIEESFPALLVDNNSKRDDLLILEESAVIFEIDEDLAATVHIGLASERQREVLIILLMRRVCWIVEHELVGHASLQPVGGPFRIIVHAKLCEISW